MNSKLLKLEALKSLFPCSVVRYVKLVRWFEMDGEFYNAEEIENKLRDSINLCLDLFIYFKIKDGNYVFREYDGEGIDRPALEGIINEININGYITTIDSILHDQYDLYGRRVPQPHRYP